MFFLFHVVVHMLILIYARGSSSNKGWFMSTLLSGININPTAPRALVRHEYFWSVMYATSSDQSESRI